jgi:transposase-like protein
MRYPAAEKLEIIRLVEQSSLPVRHTLAKLGIPAATFYRWYDRYSSGGPEALNDRSPRPDRVWNRILPAHPGRGEKPALQDLSASTLGLQHFWLVSGCGAG